MQPTNHTGKEFTDEQWDDLLSKTFGPATPSTNIPETKPPEPEPIAETTTPPTETAPPPAIRKPRKLKTKAKLWLAAFTVVLIAAVSIFLYPRNAPTPEYKQCMEALEQWQSAQCYRLDVSTIPVQTNAGSSSNTSVQISTVSTYLHSEENRLYWSTVPASNTSFYVGKAKQGDNWFTYASTKLIVTDWDPTSDETSITLPWIMNYSLNDSQILNQQVIQESENVTVICFTVIDTKEEAEHYGLGVYYLNYYFREDQLYAVARIQPDPVSMNMSGVWFNFSISTPEIIASMVQRQLSSPQSRPGFFAISSTIQPRSVE